MLYRWLLSGRRRTVRHHRSFQRLPSVTEGHYAPAGKEEPVLSQFRAADWIVPPVIVPLFLLMLVAAAALLHG